MWYSCSHIIFCSICTSQNRIEVLFFPPKISVLVRRKRKPTTCLVGLETCGFIFTKMLYKTKGNNGFAEILQERTRRNTGYFIISEM